MTPTAIVDLVKYLAKGALLIAILAGMFDLVLRGAITAQALYSMVGPLISVLIGHQLGVQSAQGQNPFTPPKQ